MSTKKSENFMNGIMALMVSQIVVKALGMVYSLYLTNKKGFGDSGNAICMSAYQMYAVFLTISSIGIPNAISKIVAENLSVGDVRSAKRIFKVSVVIFAMIGLVCSIILYFSAEIIAVSFLQIPSAKETLQLLAPSIFFVSISSVIRGYFNGKQNIRISAMSQTFEQTVKTVLTIILVEFVSKKTFCNTELMAQASILGASIATIISFGYILKKYIESEKENYLEFQASVSKINLSVKEILKEILSISIPISISSFLTTISSTIDSFTIIRLLKEKVGLELAREKYGILSSKVELLTAMPLSLNGAIAIALVPEIARLNLVKKTNELKDKIDFSFFITMFISVPIMIGMYIYSENIINLLYPNANKGGELLRIASLSIIFTTITQTMSGILQGIGRIDIHLKIMTVAMFLKLLLNCVFISNSNILEKGALLSSLICDILVCTWTYFKIKDTVNVNIKIFRNFCKIFILSIISIYLAKILMKVVNLNQNIEFVMEVLIVILIYFLIAGTAYKLKKWLKFNKI